MDGCACVRHYPVPNPIPPHSPPFTTHPTTTSPPPVYRFLFFFSLVAVLYLSSIAHLLMQDSPLFRMHSPAGLTRREMGWAVVEVRRVCGEGWDG